MITRATLWTAVTSILALAVVGVVLTFSTLRTIPLTVGMAVDEYGLPVAGAVVASAYDTTITLPDGTFTLSAQNDDTLLVRAFGYDAASGLAAITYVFTLSSLPTANAKVSVVGPNNEDLADALIYHLDPNTSGPAEEAITDASGDAIFEDITSGQAMFVALHPDYDIGWAETTIDPDDYAHLIIRLQAPEILMAAREFVSPFVAVAQAGEIDTVRQLDRITVDEVDVTQLSDTRYRIVDRTKTYVAVGPNDEAVRAYIADKKLYMTPGVSVTADVSAAIDEVLGPDRVKSVLTTTTIISQKDNTTYEITHSNGSLPSYQTYAAQTHQQTVEIEIRPATRNEVMAVMRRDYAVRQQAALNDPNVAIVTTWAQAEAAELAGKTVYLDTSKSAERSVCCEQNIGDAWEAAKQNAEGDRYGKTQSSNHIPPVTLVTADSFDEHFFYRSVRAEFTPDEAAVEALWEKNPTLTYTDAKTGKEVSLIDVATPHPDDAPKEFVLDYFDGDEAHNVYAADPDWYGEAWLDYLAVTGYVMVEKEGMSPADFVDDLSTLIVREMNDRMQHTKDAAKAAEIARLQAENFPAAQQRWLDDQLQVDAPSTPVDAVAPADEYEDPYDDDFFGEEDAAAGDSIPDSEVSDADLEMPESSYVPAPSAGGGSSGSSDCGGGVCSR